MIARGVRWLMALSAILALSSACASAPGKSPAATPLPAVSELSGTTAEGRLEPIRFATIAPSTNGLVSEVLAKEGDPVDAGQVIAVLDNQGMQSLAAARTNAAVEVSAAYEAVRVAQGKLDDFNVPRVFSGMTAPVAVQTWLEKLDAARVAFVPYRDTSRKSLRPNHIFPSLPSRVWFDTGEYHRVAKEYKKQLDIGWMNYTKAVLWLRLVSDLEAAEARLARAQANSSRLQDPSLSEATAGARAVFAAAELRAPFAGTISKIDLKVGELVPAGKGAVTIADFSSWVVKTTDLTEIDVVNVMEGQPVTMTLDAVPNASFDGRILSVAKNFSERQGDIVYEVTILLPDKHPDMRWGMTAQVKFDQ